MRDIKKALVLKIEVNPVDKLPKKYYKFLNIFLKKEVNQLSSYRLYNYKILLKLKLLLLY